ncbi:MAG: IgGFc-binding protein [Marinilabiliales bacterium]|nr:IgGFc-binding protein [Marinilabiliales bacterium]
MKFTGLIPDLFGTLPVDPCQKSSEGKEFWFGFLENRLSTNPFYPSNYLEITLVSRFSCHYTLSLGNSATPLQTGVLNPDAPVKIRIDRTSAEPFGSENVEQKGLHLVSDQPLNLYALNWGMNSCDASVIFPVDALGNEYLALCYEPHISELPGGITWNGKNSEFVVVASEDQTVVTITPSKVTDKLKPANVPFEVVLNKGELMQVQSMNHLGLVGQGDLTGSHISADKPIALYSGSWATTVPNTAQSAWDHLYEQIPPLRSWGRKFITVPLKSRNKDTYRILAGTDQTTVRISGMDPVHLNRGDFFELMRNSNEPALVESDHPVLLAQYSNSNDVDLPASLPTGETWDGDPSMLIISPVDQTRDKVTFVAYDTPEILTKIFVNVVASDEAAKLIKLDGNPVPFQSFAGTGYSYAQVKISLGNHNLESSDPTLGFLWLWRRIQLESKAGFGW